MPHIRFRSVKSEHVAKLSASLVKDLAHTMQTSEDNFTFELVPTQFFSQGQIVAGYPFVEVFWFERAPEIQNACAKLITDEVKKIAGPDDVAVVFMPLLPKNYYENGQHF